MQNIIYLLLAFIFFNQSIFSQKNNSEFRATWVITWEFINGNNTIEQNKARIRKILDDHKAANMTSVVWQARQRGTAYYNSSFEPWGSYAGSKYPGFDPLEYAVQEAHKRGLEIHAWINTFEAKNNVTGAPAQKYPEWICTDRYGNKMQADFALSPGIKAVRDYIQNVTMEIVRNYDVDGIHFDYIRWNEYRNPANNERYIYDSEHPYSGGIPAGFSSWADWRRWTVTEFIKGMKDSVMAVKPWVKLSIAALGKYNWSGWQGYDVVYQDAALWFNEGYIDQIMGMHYHWTTGDGFLGMLQNSCPECWGQFIQPGVAAGRLFSVGPYSALLSDNDIFDNHIDIVEKSRTVSWVDGFQFFSYGSWAGQNYWKKAKDIFFNRKTKVRSVILNPDSIPSAPIIALQKNDSMNYLITVSPPPGTVKDNWYAIYRSENNSIDVNNDEILEIFFGSSDFTFTDSFSGTQDFNGKYKYAATMLNRYWIESPVSSVVESDNIPSFAPVIVKTFPEQGDTVEAGKIIELYFSKSIDQSTIENSISIIPSAAIQNISWLQSENKITISLLDKLDYDTEYSLVVSPSLKDVNGRELDGNGDGIEGDEFILTFRTVEQDLSGPIIIASYPSGDEDKFDVEGVISIEFDELINASTINHSSVKLLQNNNQLSKDTKVYTYGSRNIINMKTQQPLLNNAEYSILLTTSIEDVHGNKMDSESELKFKTSDLYYNERKMIDDFSKEGFWEAPGYSGSTRGIVSSGTAFGYTSEIYLPASTPAKAAYLKYEWDIAVSSKLLREYLSKGAPRDIVFDTSYVLQIYIYGDGSGTRFRFALDEGNGTSWPDHEVSIWYTIDWAGWRLIEWQLSDPSSVGTWIGNSKLDNALYRIDSFQLTDAPGSAVSGMIYFDNLRIVKKNPVLTSVAAKDEQKPGKFVLYQNYPNPFNPSTTISFDLDKAGYVKLEVFDILGRKVETLTEGELDAGNHRVIFDASGLSSGVYIYTITNRAKTLSRRMMLIK